MIVVHVWCFSGQGVRYQLIRVDRRYTGDLGRPAVQFLLVVVKRDLQWILKGG